MSATKTIKRNLMRKQYEAFKVKYQAAVKEQFPNGDSRGTMRLPTFKEYFDHFQKLVHKRNQEKAIRENTETGDSLEDVDLNWE